LDQTYIRMSKKAFLLLITTLWLQASMLFAQDAKQLKAVEDSLVVMTDSVYHAFLPDDRAIYNEKFVKQLVRVLKTPNSFDYGFDSLAQRINIIYPQDRSFRIFNWSVSTNDVTQRYYGAIQLPGEQLKLYGLVDCSSDLGRLAEDSVLKNGKWYGALYYKIIENKVEGESVYTLLGKNATSAISNKKVMDPLTITPTGPVFGASIFNVRSQSRPNDRINRFVIEYKKQVQASLNWDNEMRAIFFDKLVSDVNDPNRKYTYVPSGQYDGFRWVDGYWNYIQDLIPIDVLKDGDAPTPVPVKAKE
jgi:hypothetical protein